jgi:hypothetical protein
LLGFALIAWVTLNRFHPSAEDFSLLRLFLFIRRRQPKSSLTGLRWPTSRKHQPREPRIMKTGPHHKALYEELREDLHRVMIKFLEDSIEGYEKLAQINPTNEFYREQRDHCQKMIAQLRMK